MGAVESLSQLVSPPLAVRFALMDMEPMIVILSPLLSSVATSAPCPHFHIQSTFQAPGLLVLHRRTLLVAWSLVGWQRCWVPNPVPLLQFGSPWIWCFGLMDHFLHQQVSVPSNLHLLGKSLVRSVHAPGPWVMEFDCRLTLHLGPKVQNPHPLLSWVLTWRYLQQT